MPFAPDPIVGAPSSATEVSETAKVLMDGTRNVSTGGGRKLYRDSQGRTRIERISPTPGFESPPELVTVDITDPVAGYAYILDTNGKVAHRMKLPEARKPASPAHRPVEGQPRPPIPAGTS